MLKKIFFFSFIFTFVIINYLANNEFVNNFTIYGNAL